MTARAARRGRPLVFAAALVLASPMVAAATSPAPSASLADQQASGPAPEAASGPARGGVGTSPGTPAAPGSFGVRGGGVAGDGSSPVPPTAQTATASGALDGDAAATVSSGGAGAPDDVFHDARVIVTKDAAPAGSDHALLVGAWGIEVRPVATTLPVFSRRLTTGCPLAQPVSNSSVPGAPPVVPGTSAPSSMASVASVDCPPVPISMLSVRHWVTHNLAWTVGAALALGGGRQSDRSLDTYFGFGPGVGLSLLLGNWRHLAVAASPSVALVWFKAAGSAPTTYLADLRAELEGELHFGFIGVPALSLALRSGVLLRLEKAADVTLWSASVSGATSLKGLVSDLSLRYYF
ncbi:MAG: hypothetical protein ABIW57_00075 [Polyangia bacterium]